MSVLDWVKTSGGSYDETALALKEYEGMGTGAVALRDISEGTALFTIPDNLLLSAYNSSLRPLIAQEDWIILEKEGGWASLMLCMMWEDAQGVESKWNGYMNSLPKKFDTPMFWSEEDLKALQGTDIIGKLGRESANAEYTSKIKPLLEKYPSVFTPPPTSTSTTPAPFSLDDYHLQGSRILSRSFTVEADRTGRPPKESRQQEGEEEEEDDDEEEEEYEEEQVMVPLADMLNAAFERDNANLYHEEGCLKMVAVKDIPAGEQIFNTYGSPPNSHLLRKYGHVDVFPLSAATLETLPEESRTWPFGNMGDDVDLAGDEVVEAFVEAQVGSDGSEEKKEEVREKCRERIEWWLEEGEDDTFTITYGEREDPLPLALIAFTRLIVQSPAAWSITVSKGRVPKPKIETTEEGLAVVDVLEAALKRRLARYGQPLKVLLARLEEGSGLGLNERNAKVVSVGEQRVLEVVLGVLRREREGVQAGMASGKRSGKDEGRNGKSKKQRVK